MKFIQFLNHHTKKITLTLCAVITFECLSPTLALALTAGPTAPEATSFEPVDTTDMVNPLTGSLTYNLPLLDVPGPEGGYPLSLSYHAGIQPDVEASWVGLGWTLNPGAINRNVAGLPDDFSDVTFKRRDYWAGGNKKEFGLEVGFASVANVGLVFASDTYQGFGMGANFGVRYEAYGVVRMGLDVGIGPYGGEFVSASASVGIQVVSGIAAGINAETNFKNVSFGAGASLVDNHGRSLISASMNTSSNKPSLSLMGINSTVYNKNAGKISSSGSGFGITIPLKFFSIGVSFKSERYWIDETAEVETNGSLYIPVIPPNNNTSYLDNRTFDNYRLLPDRLNIADDTKDQEMVGGTYPEYDNYSISGQGIGGQIKPFLYQRALSLQNQGDYSGYALPEVSSSLFKSGVGFRFVNDFSNTFDQGFGDIVTQGGSSTGTNQIPFSMDGKPDNRIGNELTSSKHIKYFTNDEIKNNIAKAKGFIDVSTTAKGFQRLTNGSSIGSVNATKAGSQIGGFMVTNESGVTYHYALPVYTYDEFSYNYTLNGGFRSASTTRKEPYAYTWLLTAVTGPDYVDRNGNGLVDEQDWGYWTAMDYGKWTDDYYWRTPAEGQDQDLDQNYKMYSQGIKQLYYLNKIRTRTHTAIFEKDVRIDGKGTGPNYTWRNEGNIGGFSSYSAQSLKLSKIYLLNNSDASILNEQSSGSTTYSYNGLFDNVIDFGDVNQIDRSVLESKAIRIVDFGHDYSLVQNTSNSFRIEQPSIKYGKLTLNAIQFRGKGGADLLPATKFSYDVASSTFKGNILSNNQFISSHASFPVGTMIEQVGVDIKYCGMITKVENAGTSFKYTLSNGQDMGSVANNIDFRVTKNPNYCRDCQDVWGYYKGDLIKSELAVSEDLAKRVTPTSARGVDAWNLRKISSPLGSSIELDYESNEFQKSVFQRDAYISIKSIEKINDYNYRVEISGNRLQFDEKYQIGDFINGLFFGYRLNINMHPNKTAYRSWSGNKECFFEGWTSDNKLNLRFTRKLDNFQAGNIYLTDNDVVSFGGGARIKSVSNKMMDNTIYQTTYNYREANVSTGVNSYLPNTIESGYFQNIEFKDQLEYEYKKDLNKDLDNILKYAREIPGPGVMYGKVRIQSKVIKPNGDSQVEGFTENRYRVLDSNMINRVILQDHGNSNEKPDKYNTYNVNLTIADFTANVGDLLGIKYYDAEGMLLKEIENHYIIDDIPTGSDLRTAYRDQLKKFNSQGLVVERFAEVRSYKRSGDPPKTNIVMAAREQFPAIMLYSTIKDYINGSSETSQNLGFDFLNGQANKVLTTDSYGNRFLSETSFAYQQNTEMGSKLINKDYKNMMSQVFSQIDYKVDANNNKTGVISGSKTIWSKDVDVLTPAGTVVKQNSIANGTVWRKKQVEVLEIPTQYGATGILPISAFSLTNGYWKLTNVLSLYNVYSKGLEDFDRNNNYSANRYGYKNSKIIAGANFSKYAELAFSGAEDELTATAVPGEVSRGGATVSSSAFHTGSKSLSVPATGTAFEYSVPITKLTPNRTYVASVWVKNTANGKVNLYYDVDGVAVVSPISSAQSTKKSGDWTLVNLEIPAVAGTTLKVFVKNDGTAASFVDDFRFHPKNTSATAYVYDTFSGELTYILDHLNLFTRFEYDAMGRLVRTYKEQFGRAPYKTNEYQINYGSKDEEALFYNDAMGRTYRKNDCAVRLEGSEHFYQIAAGVFSSKFSKADANEKVKAELDRLGQKNANTIGVCSACKTFKFTVGFDPATIWIKYRRCGVSTYTIMPLSFLGTDINGKRVFTICTEEDPQTVAFGYSQNGSFYTGWTAVTYESLGACSQ